MLLGLVTVSLLVFNVITRILMTYSVFGPLRSDTVA
jgi:hypothetical protein